MSKPFTVADFKAVLAQHGQSVHPQATLSYVQRPKPGEHAPVVILDRVVKDVLPEYCTHGYAECVRCYHPCWLGDQTQEIITSGDALPLCMVCATEIIPPGSEAIRDRAQVRDHRRADGPH